MTPLLVLEINEVPWRLLDRYIDDPTYPNIKAFFSRANCYTSTAVDSGELSPWVTWPSMHRGMNNEAHGVFNLGQDPASFKGKPIWQELLDERESVGVCGAMQSWPPVQPGEGGFYVPDTFAHDAACFPKYLEPLQSLNLSQVKKNPRVLSSALPSLAELRQLMSCATRAGIRVRTVFRFIRQLVGERFDRGLVARRPVFQTILFWDVFRKHFNPASPPAYSSFFTNHVAGVMHRYWKDVFPEDFPGAPPSVSREPLMRFALSVLDEMMADVLAWTHTNPELTVVFASSMGQGPVHRDYHEGVELHIVSVDSLLAASGLAKTDYKPLLAMIPQVAAEIPDPNKRAATIKWLGNWCTSGGSPLFDIREVGISVSISTKLPPRTDIERGVAKSPTSTLSFAEMGLRAVEIDAGTGYHIPEGTFAVFLPQSSSLVDQARRAFPASNFKRWALNLVRSGQHDPTLLTG